MTTEKWLSYLNTLTDEELEEEFVGMTVRILKNNGRIVRVQFNAL